MFLFLHTVRQDYLLHGSPVLFLLNFCFYTEKEDVRLSSTNSSRLPRFPHWKQLYRRRAVLRSLGRSTGRTGTYGITLILSFALSDECIPNHGGIKVPALCVGSFIFLWCGAESNSGKGWDAAPGSPELSRAGLRGQSCLSEGLIKDEWEILFKGMESPGLCLK